MLATSNLILLAFLDAFGDCRYHSFQPRRTYSWGGEGGPMTGQGTFELFESLVSQCGATSPFTNTILEIS
jgi:hypothetical protein